MALISQWEKQGQIFAREGGSFFKSHTTRPIPFLLNENILRIYFSSRNEDDMPFPTFIDVDPVQPHKILYIEEEPMMGLGRKGTFDDSGITPVSILNEAHRHLIYYVGWKRRRFGVTIETSIGVAELKSDGSMKRLYEGPIIGQDINHPILTAAPYVVKHKNKYIMWYCSGTEWIETETGPEMLYTVFWAESDDAINWRQLSKNPVIPFLFHGEVVSAPWVIKTKENYQMWYSTRGSSNKEDKNYSVGVAVSYDGEKWERMDKDAGLATSASGWDSEMVCYPAIINVNGNTLMFYCGNNVGAGGIGYAIARKSIEILEWQ